MCEQKEHPSEEGFFYGKKFMTNKTVPFSKKQMEEIIKDYPTPFHIYDEKAIIKNARHLLRAFSWNKGFKEFFAIKALPNPYVIRLLHQKGFGADCSALAELFLAEQVGMRGEEIMFTSNDTSAEEYIKARELGAIINLDDITHIDFLEKHAGFPDLLSFRYNPGKRRAGGIFIGKPEEAKFGLTREQLFEAYAIAKRKGVKRFGLHTMIASNELNPDYFIETADMLFALVQEISEKVGITFDFINMGGGIGIPYHPDDTPFSLEALSRGIKKAYQTRNMELPIYMENGRLITGPYGYLVTRVIHTKDIYKNYIGLDASMANLMRPGMYGAYHHISILGKERNRKDHVYDVVGSLCENNDKFAVDRKLPKVEVGDIAIIHDTGAHGHTMGFNYNGKLRSAELLLREEGSVQLIRRAEMLADYFRTLDFTNEFADLSKIK